MNRMRSVSFAILVFGLCHVRPAAAVDKVLIYDPTVTGGASSIEAQTATQLNFTVDLVTTASAWQALTATDFKQYRAIILGDPICSAPVSVLAAPESNANVWGPLVNGNVIIVGTDPAFHDKKSVAGATTLSQRAVAYATAQPGKLGAYISLSCYYANAPSGTPVPLLNNAFGGTFTVKGSSGFNTVHMTATSGALTNPLPSPLNTVPPLSDSVLSNWGASTHEIFETWLDTSPNFFDVLAIAVTGSTYTAPDGTVGTPYILARGDIKVLSDISLTPESAVNNIGTSHTLTATITPPAPGVVVVFKILSGPNAGLTFTAVTNASGKASFTYASTTAGTDVIQAQFIDKSGKTQTANLAKKQWIQTPKSCLRILQSQLLCELDAKGKPTGNYIWKFRIQNLSGIPISHLFIANIAPAIATPDHLVFSPPLANGAVSAQQQIVLKNVVPGLLHFTMSLHDDRLDECCSIPVTLDLPSCECGQIVTETLPSCPFFSFPPPFKYTFNLQNLSPVLVENLLIAAVDPSNLVTPIPTSQLIVTKDVIPVPATGQGGTIPPQTLSLSGPLAKGGQKVCLRISLHEKDLDPCCSIVRCFTLPSCFIDPVDFDTIGNAAVRFDEGSFTIGGIGSSGDDGIKFDLDDAEMAALRWEPLDAAGPLPNGAFIELRAAGNEGDPSGSSRVTQVEAGRYQINTKIDGTETYRAEVFNGETLVGTGTRQGVNVIIIWPIAAGVELVPASDQDHHETLGFFFGTEVPVPWQLSDGSTLTGDRLRITPEQHGPRDATLQTLELRAANIPSITVTSTVIVHDCDGNGVPDAEDIANGTSLDLNENGVPDECEDLNTISLSTGFNEETGGVIAFGADDDDWLVVAPGAERQAKVVVDPHPSWRTLSQSRWISVNATRGASLPNVTTIAYERCFCLTELADNVSVDLRLRADNEVAAVTLNGTPVSERGGLFSDLEPLVVQRSGKVGDGLFVVGRNCLRVEVADQGIFTGLDASGSVTTTGGECDTP